jgi:SAM-dependent methyltransferase
MAVPTTSDRGGPLSPCARLFTARTGATAAKMGFTDTLRAKGLGWLDQNQRIRDLAVAAWAAGLPAGTAILDAGAGNGHYAPLFKHCRYTASDHPDVAYAPTDFPLVRGDITAIPLPDASQEAILFTEVLEHVEDPLAVRAGSRPRASISGRLLRHGAGRK